MRKPSREGSIYFLPVQILNIKTILTTSSLLLAWNKFSFGTRLWRRIKFICCCQHSHLRTFRKKGSLYKLKALANSRFFAFSRRVCLLFFGINNMKDIRKHKSAFYRLLKRWFDLASLVSFNLRDKAKEIRDACAQAKSTLESAMFFLFTSVLKLLFSILSRHTLLPFSASGFFFFFCS